MNSEVTPDATVTPSDQITSLADLRPGMILEGEVTNVTKFGAFVNVGIKETGLVHISEIANQFVVDPNDFVQTGQKITILVIDVDHDRGRISLSMKRLQNAD